MRWLMMPLWRDFINIFLDQTDHSLHFKQCISQNFRTFYIFLCCFECILSEIELMITTIILSLGANTMRKIIQSMKISKYLIYWIPCRKVSVLSTNWRMTPNICSRKIVFCWKFTDVLWRITWLSSTKEHVQKKVDRKMQQHSLWLTIQLKLLKWIERGKVSYSKSSSITKKCCIDNASNISSPCFVHFLKKDYLKNKMWNFIEDVEEALTANIKYLYYNLYMIFRMIFSFL